jgi:hypothetical protein
VQAIGEAIKSPILFGDRSIEHVPDVILDAADACTKLLELTVIRNARVLQVLREGRACDQQPDREAREEP